MDTRQGVPELSSRINFDRISGSREARIRLSWSTFDQRIEDASELVIWRIDRIGCSMTDVVTTVKDLINRGGSVKTPFRGIDLSTREGRPLLNLMAAFAE